MKYLLLLFTLFFTLGSEIAFGQSQNYLINGGFDFWQRVNMDGSTMYHADRWYKTAGTTSKASSSLPNGQKYGIQLALSSQVGWLCQRIERDNIRIRYGQKMTISGYVKSTSGTNSLKFKSDYPNAEDNYGGNGFLGSSFASDISSQTLLSSTSSSWTKFRYTFTVSSNAAIYGVQVCLGNDSSVTNTYQLSSIMLNEGIKVLPFRLYGNTIDNELKSCLRYFEKTFQDGDSPSGSSAYAIMFSATTSASGGSYQTLYMYPKRNESYTAIPYSRNIGNNSWSQECPGSTNNTPYFQADQKKTRSYMSFTQGTSCGAYFSFISFGHWVIDNEL